MIGRYAKGHRPDSPELRASHSPLPELVRAAHVPPTGDLRPFLADASPRILDQGGLGTCTANAVAQAVRVIWARRGEPTPVISRLALYYESGVPEGVQRQDVGRRPSDVFAALAKFGAARESRWQYVESRFDRPPPASVYRDGFDLAGKLRTRRCETATDVRASISAGYPVCLAVQVDDAFEGYGVGAPDWTYTGPDLGGHYILAVAYRSGAIFCLSSWSESYGDGGGIWISDAEFASGRVTDMYAVLDEPELEAEAAQEAS